MVDQFEQVLLAAVDTRLKADVPVGSYLSGGVDSSIIAALACHLRGSAINTYTVRVDSPELDELEGGPIRGAPHQDQAADRPGFYRKRCGWILIRS